MKVVCHIRYEIDPFRQGAFEDYAFAWKSIIRLAGETCWAISCRMRARIMSRTR
jgi:hypothetical protein